MKIKSKAYRFRHKYVNILGVKIDSTQRDELLKEIEFKVTKKICFYIVTPNPEIILQAQSYPDLLKALNSADFAIPDGVGLRLVERSLKIIKGRDMMVDLFKLAEEKKLKVYLLGSTRKVMERALYKLKREFPKLKVKGNSGPSLDKNANPVLEVDTNLQSEIVDEVNSFKPDLLFVAFGAPKQEKWICKWRDKMNVTGIMAVGGGFDYYAGEVKGVPKLFAGFGFEWLWRLIQEPKRVRRIFNATVIFPLAVILAGWKSKSQD